MEFFTKHEIISRAKELKAAHGDDAVRADINLALLILGSSLFGKKIISGEDYGSHPLHVGMSNTHSIAKKIIGFLHDVVEDSSWNLDDLAEIGFSERIISAVDGLTHRENECYFDAIERCSHNSDSIDTKIEDLRHNLDQSRHSLFLENRDIERIQKYKIAFAYLVNIKMGHIKSGSTVEDFVQKSTDFENHADEALEIIAKFKNIMKTAA